MKRFEPPRRQGAKNMGETKAVQLENVDAGCRASDLAERRDTVLESAVSWLGTVFQN